MIPRNFELRRAQHAIGEFTATINFFSPINAVTFSKVVAVVSEVAQRLDLPAPANFQVFQINFGNPVNTRPAAGIGFQRFASNGEIAASIRCDNDSIIYTLREYTRWREVADVFIPALLDVCSAYIEEVPAVKSIAVQYLNEFRAVDGDPKSSRELFRADTRWVAPISLDDVEPWHSHTGHFVTRDRTSRYLVNVNYDVSPSAFPPDQLLRTHGRLLILSALHFDLPGQTPLVVSAGNIGAVLTSCFNEVHSLEKRVLGEVVSDLYLSSMGEGAYEQ